MTNKGATRTAAAENEGERILIARQRLLVEPDAADISDMMKSTGWSQPAEPVSLSSYFLARAIYPRLSDICARLGVAPLHETQSFRCARPRPEGTIAVVADYERMDGNRLQVDVRLEGTDGRIWMDGKLTFLLLKQIPER